MQILNRLYSRTNSPKALIYLFLASHAILLVMMTTTLPRIQAQIGGPAFDLRPLGYTVAEAKSMLANLNPETIELYLFPQITLLDLAYPALLALFLSKLLFRIFHLTNTKKNSTLLLLPFLAMFFDYLENNCIVFMITDSSEVPDSIVQLFNLSTVLKSMLTSITWLAIIIYFLKWLKMKFLNKKSL